jgi:hypothetical protein
MDWLEKHPGGTMGEFNKYWDFKIDPKEKAVRMTCPPYAMLMHTPLGIRAKGKGRIG